MFYAILGTCPHSTIVNSLHAACKLVYLGIVEVLEPGDGESVVRETVEQLKTSGPLTTSVVTFKASVDGIAITHDISG